MLLLIPTLSTASAATASLTAPNDLATRNVDAVLTRCAAFVGTVRPGLEADMRSYVDDVLAPLWRQFTGATEVRVMFSVTNDAAGPPVPLVLAIDYEDEEAMEQALASPARYQSRDLLPAFYERFFDEVQLLHYLMESDRHLP